MIENQPNELTLIYHSDKADDRKARAYIESITAYKVKSIDLKVQPITETQLAEVAHKMRLAITHLFDKTYQDRARVANRPLLTEFDDHDLLTVLTQETILIKTPIAIIGKQAYLYNSANDLLLETSSTNGLGALQKGNIEERQNVF